MSIGKLRRKLLLANLKVIDKKIFKLIKQGRIKLKPKEDK